MTTEDVNLGMRLKTQAGWNQTPADWRRFLDLEPRGCFVAEWNGQPVATTTTCTFGRVAWIAMVLVDESFRHRKIASGLMEHALEYLEGRGVSTARLDATHLGRPVYERLGFVAEHELARFQGVGRVCDDVGEPVVAGRDDFGVLVELDQRATGTDRKRLLERLTTEFPDKARVVKSGETVEGYTMLRRGANAHQIGPSAALTEEAGRTLGDWALNDCLGQPVFIDVPLGNQAAVEWIHERGFVEQRRFSRMSRGASISEDVRLLWASSGPEKG